MLPLQTYLHGFFVSQAPTCSISLTVLKATSGHKVKVGCCVRGLACLPGCLLRRGSASGLSRQAWQPSRKQGPASAGADAPAHTSRVRAAPQVTGLIVSEQAGAMHSVQAAGSLEYVAEIAARDNSGKFELRNHVRRRALQRAGRGRLR